jgi:hypothetical protein
MYFAIRIYFHLRISLTMVLYYWDLVFGLYPSPLFLNQYISRDGSSLVLR